MARRKKRKTGRHLFWSRLVNLLSWLGILVIFILILAVSWWSIGPRIYSYSSSRNILFFSKDNNGLISNYYLAEYITLPGENLLIVSPIEVEKSSSNFSSRAAASWQLGLIIDQLVELPFSAKTLTDYSQWRRAIRTQLWRQPLADTTARLKLMRFLFTLRNLDSAQVEFKAQYQPNRLTPQEAEVCSLAVVNTTGQTGLATEVSTLLEQSGARVVRVTDQTQALAVSSLIYTPTPSKEQGCQLWAKRIQAIFPQEVLEKDDLEVKQRQRADLVILLGEDLLAEPNSGTVN